MKRIKINHYEYYERPKKDITPVIHRRFAVLIVIILSLFSLLSVRLYEVQILANAYYNQELEKMTESIIEGPSAPRGRIYDRKGRIIVDNVAVKVISYKKPNGITTKEEIALAYKVGEMIEVNPSKLTDRKYKEFWILNHPKEANAKITKEEWQALKERKLTNTNISNLKIARVTLEDMKDYTDKDKEAAYIYTLMNSGYSYSTKTIKKDNVTDEEYALIGENLSTLRGFNTTTDWERYYPYGDTFRSILGNISSSESGLPAELKDKYLKEGYALSDRVGISYIEYQYESLLRGTKTKYKINSDGTYEVLEYGHRGQDIVLTIDIELQKAVENIISQELIRAKKNDAHTRFLENAFVVIQDPRTGEVLAMAGRKVKKVKGTYKTYDYNEGVITAVVTPGSSVKAASHMVGYTTGALKIGEVRNDACVKLAGAPKKCSLVTRGNLNDLEALKYSSNTYQFHTAMKVGKGNYKYDKPLKINNKAFATYRRIFAQYGLGVKTEIDLPNEFAGYIGTRQLPGLLLDFAIGQYDNYTPMQLSQYISTVANDGYKMQPHLLKAVYEPTEEKLTELVYKVEPKVLGVVDGRGEYLNRVKQGLHMVFQKGGTGYGAVDSKYNPAGKTGTSESYVDANKDGKIDTPSVSSVIVSYAPYNNPKVSFAVVTPHAGSGAISTTQLSKINRRISQRITKKYFEIYK